VPLTRFLSKTRSTPLKPSALAEQAAEVGVQSQQQANTGGTMRLTASLCQNGQPEGLRCACWLWSPLPHHLFPLSQLAGLSQPACPTSTCCRKAGLWAPLCFPTQKVSALPSWRDAGVDSAPLPASNAGLSSPGNQLNLVANCRSCGCLIPERFAVLIFYVAFQIKIME